MRSLLFRMRSWSTGMFHSHSWFASLAKLYSWMHIRMKQVIPFRRRSGSNLGEELKHVDRMAQIGELPGWFMPNAIAIWCSFLNYQNERDICGNMLEVGVWRGKSACCSAMYAKQDDSCFFIDRVLLPEARAHIESIRSEKNVFLEIESKQLRDHEELKGLEKSFRWIHLDGEHSGVAIREDLEIAVELLAEDGILCIDDFPSNAYPQIYFEVIRFLIDSPQFVLFAAGHNKGYLCHRDAVEHYHDFIQNHLQKELCEKDVEITVWKSGRDEDISCFGFTDRIEQFLYRGPDWQPGKISS